jgi:glycosyltransferase involved in cell wall biosynthesis
MRIIQLIDSLDAGGAERMAVNYANALSKEIEFSGLVSTRAEGDLKYQTDKGVNYFFLNRKKTIDFEALIKLKKFIKENRIQIIHAHSSSVFFAVFVKLIYHKVKIVWHDHYGNSEFLSERNRFFLKIASFFLNKVIVVNELLKEWAINNLFCKEIIYLPNFVSFNNTDEEFFLKGKKGKRILCLANLRPQKNHFLLVDVASKISKKHPDWSFHLVGKVFHDEYYQELKNKIISSRLMDSVYIYGSSNAIPSIIKQCEIGILTSVSEGLPVSLLEYGYFGLPVVVTNVGEVATVISNENGLLIDSNDVNSFVLAIEKLIDDSSLRSSIGEKLMRDIHSKYSNGVIINDYLNFISYV